MSPSAVKKEVFCPSCCAKRQVEAATHLVDHVLPMAPYRQFVVTFPIPMRYWLHSNKALFAKVYRIIIKEIHDYYKIKATASGIKDPRPGAISFTQLAGSALNLNPHLHILFCDGAFSAGGESFRFRNLEAITDKEVEKLLIDISRKALKLLKKLAVNGFSLHANTATNTLARDRLRKLVEYISRGPLSNERLEITKSGQVKLKLKTAYRDGTSHLLFTPGEFIEKLSAIIPPYQILDCSTLQCHGTTLPPRPGEQQTEDSNYSQSIRQ